MEGASIGSLVDQIAKEYKTDKIRQAQELKKVLKQAEHAGDIHTIGKIYHLLSLCMFYQGARGRILFYAYKAVEFLETVNDRKLLARSYNLLGIAYAGIENYQRAIAAYNKALDLIRRQKAPSLRREALLNNIAQCYYQMGDCKKSIQLGKRCLSAIKAKYPNLHESAVIYGINLSEFYESINDYETALDYLNAVHEDVALLGQSFHRWGYYARRSCVLYRLGKPEEAAKYADLTIDAVNTGVDSYEGHNDFEKIALMAVQVGDFKRAQLFSDLLAKYAQEIGHTLDQILSLRVQAAISSAKGEQHTAFELCRKLNLLYEQWMQEQKAIQLETQKSIETAKRETAKLMKRVRISEEQAEKDPLTGLLNRSALLRITNSFLESAKRRGKNLGGIFIDIDYFKEYNDTYGHTAGDEVLKYVAQVCMDKETSSIKFFRYGGDELFGIVLGCKDEAVKELTLRISEQIRSSGFAHIKNPNGGRITVSIGSVNVAMKHSDGSIMDIIRYADKALYRAKENGRDCVFALQGLGIRE